MQIHKLTTWWHKFCPFHHQISTSTFTSGAALLTLIWEVPLSHLGQDSNYPDRSICSFLQSIQAKSRTAGPIQYTPSCYHLTQHGDTYWQTYKLPIEQCPGSEKYKFLYEILTSTNLSVSSWRTVWLDQTWHGRKTRSMQLHPLHCPTPYQMFAHFLLHHHLYTITAYLKICSTIVAKHLLL
jgi:hypothetical protein